MEKNTIITLLDENNNEVEFDLLLTFDYEDRRYAAMIPLDEVENIAEDEVLILEVTEDGQNFRAPDNAVLLDEVFAEFLARFEELVDEEED